MEMAATLRLDKEFVTTDTDGRAADAGKLIPSNTPILTCAVAYIHDKIDQAVAMMEGRAKILVEELSLGKPVRVSDCEERAANLLDGTDSEWWTENDKA